MGPCLIRLTLPDSNAVRLRVEPRKGLFVAMGPPSMLGDHRHHTTDVTESVKDVTEDEIVSWA